jgi:hypothetical protein
MRITIKVRFDSSYPKFEKVSNNKYILYIPEPRTKESENFIKQLLSNKLGVMEKDISLLSINQSGEWFFNING